MLILERGKHRKSKSSMGTWNTKDVVEMQSRMRNLPISTSAGHVNLVARSSFVMVPRERDCSNLRESELLVPEERVVDCHVSSWTSSSRSMGNRL